MSAEDHRPMTDEPLRTTCLVCGVEQISTPITPPEWVTLPAAEFDTWKVAVKWLIEALEAALAGMERLRDGGHLALRSLQRWDAHPGRPRRAGRPDAVRTPYVCPECWEVFEHGERRSVRAPAWRRLLGQRWAVICRTCHETVGWE